MSKKSKKRIKEPKYETSEGEEIKRFIIILIIVVLLVVGVYFFTKYVVKKDTGTTDLASQAGSIDADKVSVGTMFNRPESEYYVAIFHSDSSYAMKISSVVSNYIREDKLRVYYCDLDNDLNKAYIATDEKPVNVKAKTIKELSFGEITLVKIKNNKIVEYYEGYSKLEEVLK